MSQSPTQTDNALLDPDEPSPVELVRPMGGASVVLVCDHASNRVPRRLGTLGLDARQLDEHIAWDPGAACVARHLSEQLDAPLALCGYSRLVIDCNRILQSPQSIAERSAGVDVPGNRGLSPEQRARRVAAIFRPYHDAIERLLEARRGMRCALLAIHSFTPVLGTEVRPWHVGVSARGLREVATPLIAELAQGGDLIIGSDQPYPIEDDVDHTLPAHGERRGLPNAMIEIRQDLLRTEADQRRWATRLAELYRRIEPRIFDGGGSTG
jgi:predicted N-formylglutamate amidohydrolase